MILTGGIGLGVTVGCGSTARKTRIKINFEINNIFVKNRDVADLYVKTK